MSVGGAEDEKWLQDCSVYLGRRRLGRFVRLGRQEYLAFDQQDRPLGNFRRLKQTLRAIRAALDADQ